MSKTFDELKKLQEKRNGKFSSALDKNKEPTDNLQPIVYDIDGNIISPQPEEETVSEPEKRDDLPQSVPELTKGLSPSPEKRDDPHQSVPELTNRGLSLDTPQPQSTVPEPEKRDDPHQGAPELTNRGLSLDTPQPNKSRLIITLAILAITIINIVLFITLGNFSSERTKSSEKLTAIEKSLSAQLKQIDSAISEAKRANESIKETNARIKDIKDSLKEIRNSGEAQAVAIDNLTKAKNSLYKKVNDLEADLAVKLEAAKKVEVTTAAP